MVQQNLPGYTIIGLYLTPEGQEPTDNHYIAISYDLICQLVEDLVSSRSTTLGHDVITLMGHYTQMLRRYIVGESEIEKLCHQIYRRHQKALDLIFEYRPDQQLEIKDFLCEIVNGNPEMMLDHVSKSNIDFLPRRWDIPKLREGQGWTRSGRMLLFQFYNLDNSLKLYLVLGPGPDVTRSQVFDWIGKHEPPFKRSFRVLGKLWSSVYSRTILTKTAYEEKDSEGLKEEILHRWNEFLEHDLPKMDAVLMALDWLEIKKG
jgi:hypothetical protein